MRAAQVGLTSAILRRTTERATNRHVYWKPLSVMRLTMFSLGFGLPRLRAAVAGASGQVSDAQELGAGEVSLSW